MGHGQEDAVIRSGLRLSHQVEAVFLPRLLRIHPGVVHLHPHVVFRQFADNVHHPGVAQVRAVLLEGQTKHQHPGVVHLDAPPQHGLDQLGGRVGAHGVVEPPAGEDDLRVVADGLGLEGEVVGVHADAVAAHQAGPEGQEVPLGAGRLEHGLGVDAHAVEDERQLVDQGDVQVALGVLDDLGRLGHADALRLVRARGDDLPVELVDQLGRLGRGAGGHLPDGGHPVRLVARVDPLRAVAGVEVAVVHQARVVLEHGHAVLLGGARVDRGLVDDDVAGLEHPADGGAGREDGT